MRHESEQGILGKTRVGQRGQPTRAVRQGVLERLRSETREHHERAERVVPLLSPALTKDAYRRYLLALLGLYRPLEERLAAAGLSGIDLAARRKSAWIERDLRALGVEERVIQAAPTCDDLPALDSVDRAWGCLYVLEGATLGGQILARHVRGREGLEDACAFLTAYGERTGERWTELRAALSAHAARGADEDAIVAGAKATFDAFERWIRRAEERAADG